MPIVKCGNCRNIFEVPECRKDAKYCSLECYWESMRGIKHRVECAYCGEKILRKNSDFKRNKRNFCSRKCYARWLSDNTTGENAVRWNGGKIKKKCETCGKIFRITPARSSIARFCSKECMYEYKRREDIDRREYDGSVWKCKREEVRKRDGHTCQVCGLTETESRRRWNYKLDVHHIKPISNFENVRDAHALNNLITLCKKCHGKVEWGSIECPRL